ncbi:DNA mismatch repair protein MutS [Abeliophyllum distichum]|uniref:DNA mismatch repair protein MutS n=1 Tax=Abeliophyllum distichum TaxID=126358 RepID=A0ABD1SVK0_9LAMI
MFAWAIAQPPRIRTVAKSVGLGDRPAVVFSGQWILEWPSVCTQLAAFTSTSMGLAVAQKLRIPLGRSPGESRRLLDQTSAAVAEHFHRHARRNEAERDEPDLRYRHHHLLPLRHHLQQDLSTASHRKKSLKSTPQKR